MGICSGLGLIFIAGSQIFGFSYTWKGLLGLKVPVSQVDRILLLLLGLLGLKVPVYPHSRSS